jgi:hypothetical protein
MGAPARGAGRWVTRTGTGTSDGLGRRGAAWLTISTSFSIAVMTERTGHRRAMSVPPRALMVSPASPAAPGVRRHPG